MYLDVLWRFSAQRAWLIALLITTLLLTSLAFVDMDARNVAPLMVVIAGILTFVFLTRLPSGVWWKRLLMEMGILASAGVLAIVSLLFFSVIDPDNQVLRDTDQLMLIFAILGVFSSIAIRVFARPFMVWRRMRRRRLLWEITHAQLRLVLFTMTTLFLLLLAINFSTNRAVFTATPDFVANAITLFIATAGFFGILTGLLLFVVLIPASIISYLTARQITQRLDALVKVTRTIREADISARAHIEGEDEIARLGTDFNAMLDRLAAARRDLEAERDTVRDLLESRRRMFANVSHELRTPVATIRAYLDALNNPDANPEDVAIIEREVLRLSHLIDDVFTLARSDVDGLQYTVKPLEIGAVLERTSSAMRQQAWNAKKVEIVLDYQPQIPLVLVDETRLEQIMYNLLRNAVRHTSPGGLIRVSACAEPEAVRIEVQDTGDGIVADDLRHIWERFYRSAEARAVDANGSGLGLALVKEMVEAMNGTVDVESKPGRGSCFVVRLRRAG